MLNIPFRRRPLIEELEPRLLYSADLAPLALDGLQPAPEQRVVNEAGEFSATGTQTQRHELVIVDPGVENHQILIDDILKQPGNRHIEVVLLDTSRDGIDQINEILGQQNGLDALHIISHGDSGLLKIGNGTLDSISLSARAEELATWKAALSEQADILIYGCDVATGEAGQSFIHSLAGLTGADVAASDDATGSATLGGDWLLERQSGAIETGLLAGMNGQGLWNGLLGNEFTVNTTTAGDQNTDALNRGSQNAVAYDAAGNFVVVWTSLNQDGDGYGVYARRFDAGGNALTGEISVNATLIGDQQFASVASDAAGNFVVTWTTDGASGTDVAVRRFSSIGMPLTGEIIVNTTTPGAQQNSVIAMNSATGAFVVAWEGAGTGDSQGIFFRRFNADGDPIDIFERGVNPNPAASAQNPAVAMDATGRFVIAYESDHHIYFQYFNSDGTPRGSEIQGDTNVANVSGAAIAMDGSGNFTLVYRSDYILGPGIWGRSFDDQSTQTKPVFLIGLGGHSASIAMASSGEFIVTYDKIGFDGQEIYAQKFHANGSANGSAFLVNQYTPGNQDSASVAMRDASNFVLVWSGRYDSNATGVGARIFSPGNTAPVITSNGGGNAASQAVNENTTSVTIVTATDAESQPVTFSIAGGADAGLFGIDPSTGVLSFLAAPDFENPADAGGDNVYEVTVQVDDGNGGTDSQALSVTVNDQAITSIGVSGSATVSAGTAYTLILTADEDATAWTVNWGDGTISHYTGNPGTVSHVYTQAGFTRNILAAATDARGMVHDSQLLAPTYASGDSVMRFSPVTGAYLQTFGSHGTNTNPNQAVVGPDGRLYVNQEGLNTVRRYDTATGALIDIFVTAGSGGLDEPGGMAFGPDGHLYVASYGNNKVLRYDGATGAFIDAFIPSVSRPYSLAFGADGYLYVGLYDGDAVARYDATSGALVDTFVSAGSGGLNTPEQLTFGPDGHLFVASYDTDAVLRYDGSTGNFLDAFVTAGSGGLDRPSGLSFGPDGALYVSSLGTNSILRYDGSTGAYLGAYVAAGTGGLVSPAMMTFVPQQQVNVVSGNVAPVIASNGGGATAILSMAENGTGVTTVTATDADMPAQTLTYSISGGADAGLFGINPSTGVLSFLAATDFESPSDAGGNNVYEVTVQASDGTLTDTQAISVTITNVLEPGMAVNDTFSGTSASTLTGNILANDFVDASASASVIDFTPAAHGALSVSSAGDMSYTSYVGYDGSDGFQYVLNDAAAGLSHYWGLGGNANDSIGGATGTLNNGVSAIAGQFGSALQFDGVNDNVTLPDFGYTNEFSVSFWFNISDNSGNGYNYLYAHGDAATLNSLNIFTIEHSTTGVTANDVLRTRFRDTNDTDSVSGLDIDLLANGLIDGQWHQYTLTVQAGVGARVHIDGIQRSSLSGVGGDSFNPTGNAYLGANNQLDSIRLADAGIDTLQVFSRALSAAEVTALHSGSPNTIGDVAIAVSNVNHAPTVANAIADQNATEDVPFSFTFDSNVFADADAGDTLSYSTSALPAWLGFNAPARTFTGTPANGDVGTMTVTVTADDGHGGSVSDSFNIVVASSNDAPVITATAGSPAYTENAAPIAIDANLSIVDVDSAQLTGATVSISAAYSSGQDVLAFTNQLGITGSWDAGTGVLTLTGTTTVANYQTALRSVTFVNTSENPNTSTRTMSFVVNDGAASSVAATRDVTVAAVNDAPATAAASASGLEDAASIAITLTGSDVDGTVDHFRLDSLPANGALYLDAGCTVLAASGVGHAATAGALTLYFKPAADWHGTATFLFSARDDGGGYDASPATATFTVTPDNDAPSTTGIANVGVNEDAANTVIDLFAAFADVEDADSQLAYSVTANTDPGLFSAVLIDGVAGTLTLDYAPNANGSASITVRATDTGGLWVESTFDVTVNPVNDAPTLSIGSLNVTQGETVVLNGSKLSASDMDNAVNELTYVVTTLPAEGTLAMNGTPLAVNDTFTQADVDAGLVTYTHAGATTAPDSLGIKVTDPASAESSGLVSIAISAPPPSLAEAGAPMPEPEPAPETAKESSDSKPETIDEETSATSGDLLTGSLIENEDDDKEKNSGFIEEDGKSALINAYRNASSLNPVQVAFNSHLLQSEAPATMPLLASLNRALDAIASDMNALESLKTSLGNNSFQQQLNQLQEEIRQQLNLDKNTVASTLAVSTGLSVGYVLWLVRGGVLLSSLLSSLPAWRLIDPLPILAHLNRQKHGDEDDDSLEGMLKKSANKTTPQPKDTHAP